MTELSANPLLVETFGTLYETVPFDKIKNEHFEPAIIEAIRVAEGEINAITACQDAPTFDNTILPFELSGRLLSRTLGVFHNLLSAETNDQLQAIAQKVTPLLTAHSNNIMLNEQLFQRVKAVYTHKEDFNLNTEQKTLLDDIYQQFCLEGANLSETDKAIYRELTEKLSLLSLQFDEHALSEMNAYELLITDQTRLEGLPAMHMAAAAEAAAQAGKEGWLFTLHAPSYIPFMTYVHDRALREELYRAYSTRNSHNNATSNLQVVTDIVNTSMQIAQLLGFENYAAYQLQRRMAEKATNVYDLLHQLLQAYKPTADKEVAQMTQLAKSIEGEDFTLMPWDWSYYSEKLKQKEYSLSEEMLRPYFELSKVIDGVFGLATKLYGITFKRNSSIAVYHPDVVAYEVYDANQKFLAVFYADFYPRKGKRSGAWMTEFKEQWKNPKTGEDSRPHVSIVMNFTKPTATEPALLTYGEVETFLHEFGHALHGIFSDTTYKSLCSPNVYWDFVELPSQFMENFAREPEFLHTFAFHYQTGAPIPDDLIEKIQRSSNFHAAYACLRQVSFGLLDMAWYTRTQAFAGDVRSYEQKAFEPTRLLPIVEDACMSVQFSHIFSGGYAAGYYSYKWAEVLDADAFAQFKAHGVFSQATANSFRNNVLARGATEHPMVLYKRFRGQAPTIDALLIRNGIQPCK